MITYVNGNQIQISEIYKAFMVGFSDYIIKVNLEETAFISRFFGPEGNDLSLCHVALEDGEPVGLVMGGIRNWDGTKTLRCGALCVAPNHRGKEVTKTLMERHWQDAIDHGCERLSLEVIKGNDRAIKFYEKNGYFPSYDIKYFKIKTDHLETKVLSKDILLKEVTFKTIEAHRKTLIDVHIHWQSETDYYKESTTDRHFEVQVSGSSAGFLSMTSSGKIDYLWINPKFRNKGYGRTALDLATETMAIETITVAFTNNGLVEGFFRALAFEKDAIEQFEMFRGIVEKGVCQ